MENKLIKIKGEDRWAIYSGSYKIGYVDGSPSHYVGFDCNLEIKIKELETIISLINCKFKLDKNGKR